MPAHAGGPLPDGWAFTVRLDGYAGDLAGLASRLRAGTLPPAAVPLLQLTRDLLAWVERFTADAPGTPVDVHVELLPALAGVIALKARLLLPQPEAPDDPDPGDDWTHEDPVLEGVQALQHLDELVQLLAGRRQARQGLIPAARLDLNLPRRAARASGPQGLARLVKAARNAVRDVQVPLLSVERLTLQDALGALRAFVGRLRVFRFGAVPAQDWAERSTYFAALLEGVKAGDFVVEQLETYGDIVVARTDVAAAHLAAHPPGPPDA